MTSACVWPGAWTCLAPGSRPRRTRSVHPRLRGRATRAWTRPARVPRSAGSHARWRRRSARAGSRRLRNNAETMRETLEDELRRATRNFSAPLAEDATLALGRDLLRELARAHAETPPRHPDLSLGSI